MNRISLKLTAESDLVFSLDPSTTSARTLSYIPGATLLGAAANRLYPALQREGLAYLTFHSGKVRFTPGYPLVGENLALPIPLAWHHSKGAKWCAGGSVDADAVWNLAAASAAQMRKLALEGVQLKQLRQEFVTLQGKVPKIRKQMSMKTALDATRGFRAKDSMLFVYDSIQPGTQFGADLEGDDDVPPELLQRLAQSLVGSGVRLGRSRGAEFGSVAIREHAGWERPASRTAASEVHVFYCLTDVALAEPATGIPSLLPAPEHFGLSSSDVELSPSRSFVAARRYAPFNSHRQSPSLERQVVCAGSVVVFTGKAMVQPANMDTLVRAGVGAYRSEGLGRVLYNPASLEGLHPGFAPMPAVAETALPVPEPADGLFAWLKGWGANREAESEVEERVEDHLSQHQRVYVAASKKADRPTPAQWGNVRALARVAKNSAELEKLLFARLPTPEGGGARPRSPEQREGYCVHGVEAKVWRVESNSGPGGLLKGFLESLAKNEQTRPLVPYGIGKLASRIQRKLQEQRRRS